MRFECGNELSLKAIYLYFGEKHPQKHEFTDKDFMKVIEKVPVDLAHYNFPRLLLLRFWSKFYSTAKYGNEELGVGPEKLFKDAEAKLALEHAEECHLAASGVRQWIWRQRPPLMKY